LIEQIDVKQLPYNNNQAAPSNY